MGVGVRCLYAQVVSTANCWIVVAILHYGRKNYDSDHVVRKHANECMSTCAYADITANIVELQLDFCQSKMLQIHI